MQGTEGIGIAFLLGLTHVSVLVCVCEGRNVTDTFGVILGSDLPTFQKRTFTNS